MDYRELLKKYIAYLHDVEGCDFVTPSDLRHMSDVPFTDEEFGEIVGIANEVIAERRGANHG